MSDQVSEFMFHVLGERLLLNRAAAAPPIAHSPAIPVVSFGFEGAALDCRIWISGLIFQGSGSPLNRVTPVWVVGCQHIWTCPLKPILCATVASCGRVQGGQSTHPSESTQLNPLTLR